MLLCISILRFFLLLNNILLRGYTIICLPICSPVNGHLDCFQFGLLQIKLLWTIVFHVFVASYGFFSLGLVLRSRRIGLYGGCMFSFLRNLCPWFLTRVCGTVIWKYNNHYQSYLGNSDSGIDGALEKDGCEAWELLVHVVLNIWAIKALKNSYRNIIKFM